MQFDQAKLDDAVLYICARCARAQLGSVKLNKVLYYSDMLYYAEYGRPITGSHYRKRPFGPTCEELASTIQRLAEQDLLNIKSVPYYGYRKTEFEACGDSRIGKLSMSERALLDEVIEFVCVQNSAKTISEFSHNRVWEAADSGEELPYNSVFQIFPTDVSLEALAWANTEVKAIKAERSKSDPLGYVSFADFRSRVLEARYPR